MGNTQENWVTLKCLKATTSNTFTSWRRKKGVVGGRLVMGGFPANTVQFSCSAASWLCNPMDCSTPGFSLHHHLLEFAQTQVHWVGDAIQPSHPLSSPSPSAFSFSQHQGLFLWVSSSHQVAKGLKFQLQHQSCQYSGLISFRMDWLDLLAVQATFKILLQHHSSKASILQCSAFFIV